MYRKFLRNSILANQPFLQIVVELVCQSRVEMSFSKVADAESKPLSVEEHQLLMSLQRRAALNHENTLADVDGYSEWSLAAEAPDSSSAAAMTDGSKRRLTEYQHATADVSNAYQSMELKYPIRRPCWVQRGRER